ncbi:MAG: HIT domain-containing protein [Acidimicrobiales bacterium]
MSDCLFCRIVAGEVPADVVRDDEQTLAFRDVNPQAPTHVLVVPKRHIDSAATVTAEDGDVLAAMVVAAGEVAAAEGIGTPDRGYRLVFNVGPDALNSVPHLHLHLLGGRAFEWPPG